MVADNPGLSINEKKTEKQDNNGSQNKIGLLN